MKPYRASNSTSTTAAKASRLSWVIRNVGKQAEIDIFDIIGDPWEGTTAKDFIQELRGITADQIRLNINSPGGMVDDALAIYDAIQEHPAEITAHITVAASAASFVAMGADKRMITKNGKMQIHDAHAFVLVMDALNPEGVSELIQALESARQTLEEESNNIASIYAENAGGTIESWRKAMKANGSNGTSYRGQEAVDAGLADEVVAAPARNELPGRVAASLAGDIASAPIVFVDADGNEHPIDEEIDIDLIPPLANGYKAPLPADQTRLIAANMPATKG